MAPRTDERHDSVLQGEWRLAFLTPKDPDERRATEKSTPSDVARVSNAHAIGIWVRRDVPGGVTSGWDES